MTPRFLHIRDPLYPPPIRRVFQLLGDACGVACIGLIFWVTCSLFIFTPVTQ